MEICAELCLGSTTKHLTQFPLRFIFSEIIKLFWTWKYFAEPTCSKMRILKTGKLCWDVLGEHNKRLLLLIWPWKYFLNIHFPKREFREKESFVLSCARRAQQKTLVPISTHIDIFQNNPPFLNFEIFCSLYIFQNVSSTQYNFPFFEILIFENLCSKNISKIKKIWLFF